MVLKRKKYEIRLEPVWEREHVSRDCFDCLLGCVLCLCILSADSFPPLSSEDSAFLLNNF